MSDNDVLAILCSDIHLSQTAPVARAAEPDWFEAQARPLRELRALMKEHDAPLIIAGDIFDRWNSSPEIINFALRELPHDYAIPGQHDLPNHNLSEIKRSAYWTLVEAGLIIDLSVNGIIFAKSGLRLCGFPWGKEITQSDKNEQGVEEDSVYLAVVHKYIYTIQHEGYPGVSDEQRIDRMGDQLRGYDAAVFGDNHQGFVGSAYDCCNCTVFNAGTLMRRKQDERKYRPQAGLLMPDGSIVPHYFDLSQDLFSEVVGIPIQSMIDSSEFLAELRTLGADSLDFRAAVRRRLEADDVTSDVRSIVLEAMGE